MRSELTLSAAVAGLALELVQAKREDVRADYRSLCEGFPAMLRSCGAARSLAFLAARASTPGAHRELYLDFNRQLERIGLLDSKRSLLDLLCTAQLRQHRTNTRIVMLIALWHKRIAQAILKKAEPDANPTTA